MEEFTGRIEVERSPAEVFAFLADSGNMPTYLPTVRRVETKGDNRVAIEGEAEGHAYRDQGWLEVDRAARRMRWGSGDGHDYHGALSVGEVGGRAVVEVRLHSAPEGRTARRMQERSGSVDHDMRKALEQVLGAIKAACEGAARPAVATGMAKDTTRSADDLPDSRPFGGSATLNPDI